LSPPFLTTANLIVKSQSDRRGKYLHETENAEEFKISLSNKGYTGSSYELKRTWVLVGPCDICLWQKIDSCRFTDKEKRLFFINMKKERSKERASPLGE
jgi:hypothetical protein